MPDDSLKTVNFESQGALNSLGYSQEEVDLIIKLQEDFKDYPPDKLYRFCIARKMDYVGFFLNKFYSKTKSQFSFSFSFLFFLLNRKKYLLC